jgi:hypothetical protein
MDKVNKNYGECSICMDDILDSNNKVTTKCHHTFHKDCLDKWSKSIGEISAKVPCPLCKTNLNAPPLTEKEIDIEIDDYIENWRDEPDKLSCDDLIKQIKLTYKDKDINDTLIKQKCEKRLKEEELIGGKKTIKRNHKRTKKTNKRKNKRTKKTIKRKYKNRYLKCKRG